MTPVTDDWRYQGQHFQQREKLISSLVRVGIALSSITYEFCDFTISQGWNPPSNIDDCDYEVLKMFNRFISEVWNG